MLRTFRTQDSTSCGPKTYIVVQLVLCSWIEGKARRMTQVRGLDLGVLDQELSLNPSFPDLEGGHMCSIRPGQWAKVLSGEVLS